MAVNKPSEAPWRVRALDRFWQLAKRAQKRYYESDYEALAAEWKRQPAFPFSPLLEKEVGTLLVFKPDDIGDAVCALPALLHLRESYPKARICLLVQEKTRALYERAQVADEIVAVNVKISLLRLQSFDLAKALSKFSTREFDVAVFLRTYPAFFSYFKKVQAKVKVHPKEPRMISSSAHQVILPWGPKRPHQTDQLLKIASAITGKSVSIRFPFFQWQDTDKDVGFLFAGGKLPAQFGVLHPFNKWETKRYPYFEELVVELTRTFSFPWVVIGGKEDPLFAPGVTIQAQGKLPLGQTGYLLSRATVFIGNESGPGHWAGALGTPTVTLMSGHSDPGEWAALGKVLLVKSEVPCSPCHLRVCHANGLKCLTPLTVARVLPEIVGFLKNPG